MGLSESYLQHLAMVMVQVGFAGLNVMSKLAMDTGMSPYVLVSYRQIIAFLVLFLLACFFERNTWGRITKNVLYQIFLTSTFGATMNQILYFVGLKYTTPTIACALSNTLLAVTFVMAVICRTERVMINSLAGKAKVIGTFLCVGGSMLMTFYKGSEIKIRPSGIHWKYVEAMITSQSQTSSDHPDKMALGAVLVFGSCIAWAVWFIVEEKMGKAYNSPYTSTSIMCFIASIECVILTACMERRPSSWALGFDIRLLTSVYMGVVNSGISFAAMAWCLQARGPLYVSAFSPLLLVIVAIVGWAIMNEKIYAGSVLGALLIALGMYSVLWGQNKEKMCKRVGDEECGDIGLNAVSSFNHHHHHNHHQKQQQQEQQEQQEQEQEQEQEQQQFEI